MKDKIKVMSKAKKSVKPPSIINPE